MIHRLDNLPASIPLQADLCIVGGGAAGLALANELRGSALRVIVLESGETRRTEAADDMNITASVGLPHHGSTDGRARVFGGATTAWGGQLIPLRESETAHRDWVPHSGWPLALASLAPYYRRAEKLLGVEGPPYDEQVWERLGIAPPAFDHDALIARFSQWAPLSRRNFAVLMRKDLAASHNVDVMLGATLAGIESNAAHNHVTGILVRSTSGAAYRLRARQYIMCTGGIETPRLLLMAGLANSSGALGRYFQDHISYVAALADPVSRERIRHHFEPRYCNAAMYTCKIEPTDRMQRRLGLLNCMAHIKFDIPDALGLLEARQVLRALQRGQMPIPSLDALWAMTKGSAELARLVFHRLVHARRAAPSRGAVYLLIDIEQAPNPDSRITLTDSCDALGLPRARVDWRLTNLEQHTAQCFRDLLQAQWRAARLGELTLAGAMDFNAAEGLSYARDIYHHMGTTRMSLGSGDGVVNTDLRCHDVDNLFVASSAVFPTSGIANPTFTILALTLRLAEHLKRSLHTA